MTNISISENQIINKLLDTKDYGIIADNILTPDYFPATINEYNFIKEFYDTYKVIPDKPTFIEKFPSFKLFQVDEPEEPIVSRLREEKLFRDGVPIFNKASQLFSENANDGIKYLIEQFRDINPVYNIPCTNIIEQAQQRYDTWENKKNNQGANYIGLPFKELEEDLYGFERGNELCLILAKTSTGKSQVLTACAEYASKQGFTVGFISPEMSTESISYRFDTSRKHFSNSALQRGDMVVGYKEYIEALKNSSEKFYCSDMSDFKGKITIQGIENFCKKYKIDILFIDGISYISLDYTPRKRTDAQIAGEICQRLLTMSTVLKIPIIGVVQSRRRSSENKEGDGTPDAESVYGSYEISQVVTRVISLQKVDSVLKMYLAKNRKGIDDKSYLYNYNYDTLQFQFIPSLDNPGNEPIDEKKEEEQQNKFKNIF